MSRLEKLLLALLAVLLASVILLGGLLWLGRQGAAPRVDVADARAAELDQAPGTAKAAFELAQQRAAAWAADAALLNARGNWPAGNFDAQAGSWAFIFFSPAQVATALITVGDGGAQLMTSGPASRRPAIASAALWQVDSPQVIDTLLANGGEAFIAEREQASMRLSLTTNERVVWTATLVDDTSRETFSLEIEAVSGAILAQDSSSAP